MTQKSLKIVVILSLIPYLIFFLISCSEKKSDPTHKEATLVETTIVKQGDIYQEIRLTGGIEAKTEVKVFPKITAKIEAIKFDEGHAVKRGDLLVLLESEDLRAQVAQAEAALQTIQAKWAQMEAGARPEEIAQAEDLVAKAKANLRDLEDNYERMKELFNRGVITKRQFDSAELTYTVAKADFNSAQERLKMILEGATQEDRLALQAQVRQAKAALDLAKIHLSYARITSPIDGTISKKFSDQGDMAIPSQPLFTVVQMDLVKVTIHFPENQLRFITPHTEAKITVMAYPDVIFRGRIDKVSPTLDPTTRMFSAEIKVENENRLLRPGMFATVILSVDPHLNTLLIPKTAVFYTEEYQENQNLDPGKIHHAHYIFVVREGKAYQRKVLLGHESGSMIEVREGIEKGEEVVVRGQHQLKHGDQVIVAKRGGGS